MWVIGVVGGLGLTVTLPLAEVDGQPVVAFVNVKVADPALCPVTVPLFTIDATLGLLLDHHPPVLGVKVVVNPIQIAASPDIETIGFGFTEIFAVGTAVHPILFVTVTAYNVDGTEGTTVTDWLVELAAFALHK